MGTCFTFGESWGSPPSKPIWARVCPGCGSGHTQCLVLGKVQGLQGPTFRFWAFGTLLLQTFSIVLLAGEVRGHCSQGAGKELTELKTPIPSLA